jgi:acyl-CoA synthetase (AMP-forming)/AMP-acid ligase II
MLAYWAEQTPNADALIVPGARRQAITYAELWQCAQDLAGSLRDLGFGRQDRVVLLVPEGSMLAMALLGTMSAAIALPLNSSLSSSELGNALRGFHPAGAIVVPGIESAVRQSLAVIGATILELHAESGVKSLTLEGGTVRPQRRWETPQPEDIAVVSQTSGTTGKPKRVPRSHGHISEGGRSHRDRFGLGPHDRALAVAPLTLALGRTALLHGIAAGSALIVPPSFDPPALWAAIEQERPTWMHASAGFLELLVRFLRDNAPLRAPSSFRFVRVTAAPISPAVCDELAERLGAAILPSYSSSEAGAIATALPPPAWHKPGSTGRPIQEIRIVDEHARDVAQGGEGEIWIRRPRGFAGYLDDPETNAAVLMPGEWFRTGDVGYLDGDGFPFLTGRVSELINRGGDKISPVEVDAVLLAHPAVRAGALISVPDQRLGEDIVAAVVLADGHALAPRELRRWLLDRLAPHKVPRRIWFLDLDALPLTASGKVQRGVLSERFVGMHDAQAQPQEVTGTAHG